MNKQITLGQLIGILATMSMALIGWGVSVEVKLATYKVQIDQIIKLYEIQSDDIEEMSKKIDDIHTAVVIHEEKLTTKTSYVIGRGDLIEDIY